MRSLILSLLFIAFSVFSFGQSELCLTAEGAPTALAPAPSTATTLTIDPLWTANTDAYTPPNFAGPYTVGYWSFTVDAPGYYNINIETPAVNTIIGDLSVALSDNSSGSACPMDASLTEIYSSIPPLVGSPDNVTCTFFTIGTVYTIAIAVANGNEGDVIITIADATGASNDDCAGAVSLPVGTSVGDNSCSDGLVWYSYTVVNGGTVSVSVSNSGTPTAITAPVINYTNTIGCGNPDEGVTSWTCLPPGTVVYFEAGDDTAPIEQGDFNIDIVDNATGLPNELCTDVTPVAAPSCATTTLTDVTNNTTVGACPELIDFDGCGVFNTEATVWFAFTTDANAQTVDVEVTNGTISGATFVLIDGTLGCPAAAATEAGCVITGSLLDQAILASTTYYVAVATSSAGTDGTFTLTVTPENPPTNDDCATGALDISLTSANPANLGVDGTTSCASADVNDFCIAVSEDHVVYYTYTVDAAITGNRDVTFTFTTNTNTTGTAATGLFFGLFEDCVGTAYTNTPNIGDDPCDALIGTVTYECVEPGTVLTIAVGSADLSEGDFNIMITEDDTNVPMNDACANPTALMVGTSCVDINEATDNTNGCPEVSDLGSSCMFSSDLVVWYQLVLPAGATGVDFSNLSAGAQLGLFQNDCPTLTIVDDCFTSNTQFTGLTDGGTYLLAVSQTLVAEGPVTFTWTPLAIPTNDDCDLATNPDILLETNGTTGCADHDFNTCGVIDAANDHQVFYIYTNISGATVDLEITIEADATNGNPASQVSITALQDDCTTFTGFYPAPLTNSEYCDILGLGMQTLPCIEDGETVVLLFSSADGDEGDFTIVANQGGMQPVDNNDECVDASDITPAMTCTWETVTADNNNACPEDFVFGGGCDFDVDPTVWYSFTVPAAAGNYTLEIQNISDANSYLTIFDSGIDCDAPGSAALSADCETGAGPHNMYDALTPGSTYLIAFGNPTPGIYSFEIKINLLPDNDECIDAVVLAPNTSTMGTTVCATQEAISYNSGVCADTDEENTVWYEVNVGPGEKGFNLTITGSGTNPITMGDINAVVFETTAAGCVADASTFVDEDCMTLATLSEQFECVGEGTYIIRISTSDANAGEFDILFEPLLAVMFDVCSDPDAATFNPVIDCEWMPGSANTIGACPEAFDFANNCGFDDFPVIWYQVTAPLNATELDLMTVSSTAGTPFIAVLEGLPVDCDNITSANAVAGSNCYSGIFADLDTEGSGTIDVVGGNVYYIGIGSDDVNGSMIEFEIKFLTPPLNDECVDGVVLSNGVSQMGTTVCATQATIPYNSAVCTDADEENTVWYEFTVPDGVNGFDITVTATAVGGFTGDLNIVVFESTAAGCIADASTFEDDVCATSGTLVEDFECIGPGTYVIRISTSELNEGDFDILVSEYVSPVVNDLCSNPTAVTIEPVCEWYPVDANTVDACPEQFDFASNCGFDDYPVVWYEINVTNDDATQIQINMISSTSGTPFYSVFAGNPVDCSDLTGSSVSGNCETGFGMNTVDIDIEANGPMTYLIGVGADDVNGSSSIAFEIKVIVPPMNDDPCDAEVIATVGDVNVTTMGTTECASMDVDDTECGMQDENSVWYEYTIPAGTTGFIVTLTSTGVGQDFAVGVFDFPGGCMANPNFLDPDVLTDCALEDGGELKFTCLDENTTAYIMVSTLDAEAGTFDLIIDPIVPDPLCIDNDLCAMADGTSPIATPVTDGGQVCVTDCNTEACPWDFNAGACLFTDFPTVFYTVTTDANAEDATMTVILSSADGNPIFSVIEFDCNAPTSVTPESFCVEGDGASANLANMEVDANTTYIIVVALDEIDAEGGDFDLCVNVTTSCNDDPCSPYPLVDGDGVNTIALDCDNNIGSTSEPFDYVSGDCDDPLLFASTVYFSYTVPDNISSFTLFYTNDPVNGIQNAVGINIMVYDAANCAFQQVEVVDQQCIQPGNTEPMEIDCPVSGDTYLIQITSAAGDEGEFDILITETVQDDPCAANDDCDFAMPLDVTETCEWLAFPDCNIQACPEEFSDPGGMCAFDASAVVWYTFTTPASATTAHIEVEPGSVTDPTWALLIDNGCANPPTAVNADVLCVTVGGTGTAIEEDIAIDENTTYYIVVGSESDIEGDFTLNIKIDVPPINDDPCINDDNPPLDLTGGGSHTGTTCCARGPKDENPDGSLADFENVDCSAATEDAAVWYMYTPSPDDDGYNIILESGGADPSEGPIAIEVYAGVADQGCNGGFGQTLASSCADFGVDIKIGNCLAPGEVLFVKVSTDDADENCGEFIITIVPATCGPMADECIDLADETPIEPITNPEFSIDYTCITGCLDYACPEDDSNGGCPDMTQMPTVWFQVTADDIAAQMFTTVEPMGNWTPIWSVYSGPDCDNLSVVNFGGAPPCSNGDNTPELHQTSVFDNEPNYWIAVTIDPASLPPGGLDDGSFELCVATTINAIICLGELEGGACDDESLVMEITDREIEDQPLEGPFCQGEEITINISFFYDASESGADWLIGFVPIFGPGWDLEGFDYAANAPVGNGTTAEWYEDDGDCAPLLQEPNPILCTYTDADGNLQLCNLLCSPCSECPQTGMAEGDPLPSGYFWVSNGGNPGCDNDCSPGEGWGIGSITAQIDWTFTLPVKEFDTYEECIENNDLSISFQTFSDGTAGCWEDPVGECFLDRAMFSPPWMIECEAPPAVEGPDQELCHNGITDIFVQTVDGSTNTIIVEVDDNPNVSGENNHTFPGGTGTIQDDLLNLTDDIQIVIYNVFSEDESLPCPGVVNQIEVTIYPELKATFPPVYVCEGECTDLTPDIVGGVGVPYTYVWSTGETTPSINVCPVVPTTYFVTVEDALGCMDEAEVQVDVKPPVELLLPESIDVCKDDNFDPFNPDYMVCLDFLSGSSPFGVTWNAPPGLVGSPSGVFGECFIINELLSSEFAGNNGSYVLEVSVVDFFGCVGETDMIVNITGELILVVDVLDLECGDTEAIITATGFDAVGNPVTDFFLYGGCPDDGLGDYLDEAYSATGVVTFPAQDLLAYTCYTIVAQTASGCQSTQDITIPLTEGTPIEITGTPAVCIGEDATITITNESDYTSFVWTPDIGSTGSVTFTPDSTFTYFVEATDATGCNSQAVFEVVVNDPPVISISGSTTFCEGGTASVTASGGAMYDWTSADIGGFPMTGETITVGEPGDVTLVMTDVNGCSSDTTITFTQENVITISLGDVNICDGMGDTVFVSTDFINVEWYDSTPTQVSDTSFYVITGAGSFTVQAIDGATGCDATGSFEVIDFMTPVISVTDTVEVCRIDSGIDSLCVNFNNQTSGSGGVWTQLDVIPGFTVILDDLDNVCFENAQTGCYAFEYSTNSAQAPCEDVSEIMMVCVKACPCPSPATQPIDPLCNIGTTNLEFAEVTTDAGTWSVEMGPPGQDLTGILTGTIFDAAGLLPGSYVVRFTLDNPGSPPACEQFSEQTIMVFAEPMITATDAFMCNIDNGTDPTVLDLFDQINVDASDGGTWVQSLGTSVTITGGSTIMSSDLSTFPDTLTFTYTSGVEAGSPCPPAIVDVVVVVRDCNCPFVAVLADTLCNNGGLIDLNDLLLNPDNLSGTWSTTGTLVGADMFDPNGLPSGLYTITYTLAVSPGPTCDIAYTNEILIRRQSIAVPRIGDPPCSADTGNGPTTSNLYDWLETGYSSGTWIQTGGTPTLTFTDNGLDMAVVDFDGQPIGSMFTFTFTTNDAEDPCTNITVDVTITVVDCNCPPILLAPADDLCNLDGMIDLCGLTTGSDPGTYTVMSIGGTDFSDRITGCNFDATGLNPGDYVITFTLDQMVTGICEQFLQDTFTVVQYLTSTIQDPPEVCSDATGNGLMSLNFTTYVSNAGSGVWEDTDGAGVAIATLAEQQNVSFIGVPAGQYTFTYTIDNAEPCADVILTMEVLVTDDCNCPSINPLNPLDECNTDGPIDLTQYDDPIRPGSWSSTDLTVENGNSLVIDGVAAGIYSLLYTIEEIVPDCDSTAEVMILIGEPANAGTPTAAFRQCEGESNVVALADLLEGEDIGGVWTETSGTLSGGFSGLDGTVTTDNALAGTYTFEYTLSENDPCPDVSVTVTVIIDANPVSDAGPEKFIDCINSTAILGGPNTTTGATIEYNWVNTTTGESAGTTETIEVNNAGTYELTVLNTETGCSSRSTVDVVKSDDLPTMVVTVKDISCFNAGDGGITLSDQSGGDGNYTYTLGTIVTSDPNDFNSLDAGDYIIEIMDGNGCSQPYSFTINEPPLFEIDAGEDLEGDVGAEFTLTIEPFDTTGITSLIWSNFETGEEICNGLDCVTITVVPDQNVTNYYVEAIDENGCIAFDEVQIRTQQIVDVVFPNIITPNGDNTNDKFYIKSEDVETVISMKIFDRWGEKLYDAANFPPRDPAYGWDGKFNDKKVVPGVYVFTVEVLFVNGDRETFSGDITVTDSD